MKKINLTKMRIYTDLSRKEFVESDFKEQTANALYNAGQGLPFCALALKIYNSDGEIEINEKEEEVIKQMFPNMVSKLVLAFCEQLDLNPLELVNE